MMQENGVYVPPALAEIGDFAQVTRGHGGWGVDHYWQCLLIGCD